jgi:glycosyltransferase involved in cell wall biosynthesis
MHMPRLLILCEYPTLLGGERSMLSTLPAVAAAGFEVTVAAPAEGSLAAALRDHHIPHIAWQTQGVEGIRPSLERLRADLVGILQTTRPDLLHANSLSTARISGPVAAESHVRSIGHLRDILKLTNQAVDDLNQHSRLLAVSHATRDFHVAQGLDATKFFVLNNGVDLNKFHPQPPTGYLHRELDLPPAAQLIAVIGQLGLRKGTDVALTAALQIADQAPNAHWLIVGERTSNKAESHDFEATLQSIAAIPPLAGRVHFLGTRTDVPQLLCECTLLVHGARQEPLGRVLLESAASGLAAIATNVGGTQEIFPTAAHGAHFVQPDSPAELAVAVLALLSDNNRRQALATAARLRAESAFDIRTAAPRLIEHYHSVLQ